MIRNYKNGIRDIKITSKLGYTITIFDQSVTIKWLFEDKSMQVQNS